ncbi:MAG: DUF4864 domain-containing protein [Gammaproteobacteria bacterium]|nr:DUF4864 domain-containing protein [Gammaproteobacteria bacterium]
MCVGPTFRSKRYGEPPPVRVASANHHQFIRGKPITPKGKSINLRGKSINVCCWLLAIFFLCSGTAARADENSQANRLTSADKSAIRTVIEHQLAAFQADDAARAFSYATPEMQRKSRTPERFMAMVKQSYRPVYRPRAVFFQNIMVMDGIPAQRVLLMDSRGAPVMAVFPMQRQDDGNWRIAGCILYRNTANVL